MYAYRRISFDDRFLRNLLIFLLDYLNKYCSFLASQSFVIHQLIYQINNDEGASKFDCKSICSSASNSASRQKLQIHFFRYKQFKILMGNASFNQR
jgi:CRISPR/Cas system-associated protein endoribonuclease Cas2